MRRVNEWQELPCYDHHKSFYGKAKIRRRGDGVVELLSYNTVVCYLKDGEIHRRWSGYSATTMRHINSFLKHFGIVGGGKTWWDALPLERLG